MPVWGCLAHGVLLTLQAVHASLLKPVFFYERCCGVHANCHKTDAGLHAQSPYLGLVQVQGAHEVVRAGVGVSGEGRAPWAGWTPLLRGERAGLEGMGAGVVMAPRLTALLPEGRAISWIHKAWKSSGTPWGVSLCVHQGPVRFRSTHLKGGGGKATKHANVHANLPLAQQQGRGRSHTRTGDLLCSR